MRKVHLFIAMSLDGYIADTQGDISWLEGEDTEKNDLESYEEFIKKIDTVIMGWNTFHQINTELSPDQWPYEGLTTYVITHKEQASERSDIKFTNLSPNDLVRQLLKQEGNDLWICGGASISQQLISENQIDYYQISIIPKILGYGIRLFDKANNRINLHLIKAKDFNGITDVCYERIH